MSWEEAALEAEEGMEKAVEFLLHELASIRTGKATPALVEGMDVEAYGTSMKLKQLAVITAPEARLLVIQPFDNSTVKDIERAINESKLGIMPVADGRVIRIPIPELSEERRKDLAKTCRQMSEEARVRVRSCRRNAIDAAKKLQKDGKITEDDLRSAEEEAQKLTDKYIASIEQHLASKEADLMKV